METPGQTMRHGRPRQFSRSNEISDDEQAIGNTGFLQNRGLYRAVDSGDWEATRKFLDDHPSALTAGLSEDGDTALHVAVLAGHIDIVTELVSRLKPGDLARTNDTSATALNYAAIGGITRIAEALVRKCKDLVSIPNKNGQIPVVVASLYGHKEMVHFLYSESPKEEFSPEKPNGALLLTSCILDDIYDIALDLLHIYPELAFQLDSDNDTALGVLAQKPSSFPTGTPLPLWKHWIYKCIRVPQVYLPNTHGDIERHHRGPTVKRNLIRRELHKLLVMVSKGLKVFVPSIKHMYNLKLIHTQAQELLCCLCQQISTLHKTEFERIRANKATFVAVRNGIVEFVIEMTKYYPETIWCEDEYGRGIFSYATLQRQEKIFSLMYTMGAKKNYVATSWDRFHNNMLHQAAFLAPSSQLHRVAGAALQMQRELQWYKEVESIVRPKYKELVNVQQKTPQNLFTESHRKLVEEGEKWMKETANSCTVVAALIATIMFSAIFTVPGGFDAAGIPIYLNKPRFMIFVVSDAVSLFSSSSSLLIFSGILTSRYKEEDFLKSLPTKLMIGLSCLFFSIATMMVTFGVTLVIFLGGKYHWVSFPIVMLGSLPVTLFALLQFPLLVDIFLSTYGPGIFDKPKKFWLC